uniref:Variant surface glycoprotein n=1 Tax=Trypanosoma brucei TaxID=5691 RepID=Q26713_9TRYP|nr:variant surface glycoprotein [Trypanosoma brucei rhodesiense]
MPTAGAVLLLATAAVLSRPAAAANEKKPLTISAAGAVCGFSNELKEVASFAATKVNAYLTETEQLGTLAVDFCARIFNGNGKPTAGEVYAALLAAKTQTDRQAQQQKLVTQALLASSLCSQQAGHIESFIHVFYQAHRDATTTCIYKSDEHQREAADVPCVNNGGGLNKITITTRATKPQLNSKYKAIVAGTTPNGAAAEKNCKLVNGEQSQNVFLASQTTNIALKWGDGLLTVPIGDTAISASNWEPNNKDSIASGNYKECAAALEQVAAAAEYSSAATSKLLKLEAEDDPKLEEELISKNSFYGDFPISNVKITATDFSSLHSKLKSYRKKHTADGDQLLKARLQHLEKQMQMNATACKLGAEISSGEPSTAKTTTSGRCEGKAKTACPKSDCQWEEKDGKGECKPKSGEEQKTQTTGAGEGAADKKEEKCKGKLEPECTKAPECKWEGETCKDSSILVNKQFTLSMISAAFMALLF